MKLSVLIYCLLICSTSSFGMLRHRGPDGLKPVDPPSWNGPTGLGQPNSGGITPYHSHNGPIGPTHVPSYQPTYQPPQQQQQTQISQQPSQGPSYVPPSHSHSHGSSHTQTGSHTNNYQPPNDPPMGPPKHHGPTATNGRMEQWAKWKAENPDPPTVDLRDSIKDILKAKEAIQKYGSLEKYIEHAQAEKKRLQEEKASRDYLQNLPPVVSKPRTQHDYRRFVTHLPSNPCEGCDNLKCNEEYAQSLAERNTDLLPCQCTSDECISKLKDAILEGQPSHPIVEPSLISSYPEMIIVPTTQVSRIWGLCFPGETPICVSEKGTKPIQDLHEGEQVQSCDLGSGNCELREVERVFKSTASHLISLTFGVKTLRTTEDHPFYTSHGWVPARNLKVGDQLFTMTREAVSIDQIQDEYGDFSVYNIEVQKHHNYYAEGVLVHNCNSVYEVSGSLWNYAKNYFAKYPDISTPYGNAVQDQSEEFLSAREQVQGGATLYRIGMRGTSQTGEQAQFWSFEHPLTPGYNQRYGIPPTNVSSPDFIETAVINDGASFITRPAQPYGPNTGGGIEIVVPHNSVRITSHGSL